jgi:hypothetical protein
VDASAHFSRDVARCTKITDITFASKMMVFLGIWVKTLKLCNLRQYIDTSNREAIKLAAKLQIPVDVVASPALFDFRLPQMQHGVQAHVLIQK